MQILIKNVWNNNKCWCECKNHNVCEKDYIWNPATCNCENGKYLGSVMDDSAVTCDEIISAEETHFNKKKKIEIVKHKIYVLCLKIKSLYW